MSADPLAGLEHAPEAPALDACAALLAELGRAIELGGADRFVRDPVAPGPASFPDPPARTPYAVGVGLLRLLDHAGVALDVRVHDVRDAKTMEQVVDTSAIRLVAVVDGCATFQIEALGDEFLDRVLDEVGAAALLQLLDVAPYRADSRAIDDELRRRGAVATVYLGLGVLAVNAAFEPGAPIRGAYRGAGSSFTHAGVLGVDELAFLVAVQAAVCDVPVPPGLDRVQADAVAGWYDALADRGPALRAALGVAEPDTWGDTSRAPPRALARAPRLESDVPAKPVSRRIVRQTPAGVLIGAGGAAVTAIIAGVPGLFAGAVAIAAGAYGAYVGHGIVTARCTACGVPLAADARVCAGCGGAVTRG